MLWDGRALQRLIDTAFFAAQPEARANIVKGVSIKASSLSFLAAVTLALADMVWGIQMAISADHSEIPAHAHLNLLGWVSLFLFGVFYHLHPATDSGRLALIQVWAWIVATIALAIGVGLVHSGRDSGDPIAAAASIVLLLDMALFGWLVLRRDAAQGMRVRPATAP